MTHSDALWKAIKSSLKRHAWTDLPVLYSAVANKTTLDTEDLNPEAPGSNVPKWKRNVRNVLQRQKMLGRVDWDRHARYKLQ